MAEEYGLEQAEDIVGFLESSGDLEAPLLELLTEALEGEELDLVDAEDVVGQLEKICDIEWTDEDDLLGVDELDVDEALTFDAELDDDDL